MKLKVKVESRAVCSVQCARTAGSYAPLLHFHSSSHEHLEKSKKQNSKFVLFSRQWEAAERFPGTQGQRRVNFITFLQLIDGIVRMMYDGELVLNHVSL